MALKLPAVEVNFDELNHSELVLLANWNQLGATRANTREEIIQALEIMQPLNTPAAFRDEAERLSAWINLHWNVFQMQVGKRVCPNCDQCSDLQNLECYRLNRSRLEVVRHG
jgi:hypothetical protein